MEKNIWKPVHKEPFSDFYLVSSEGEVKSVDRHLKCGRKVRGVLLAQANIRGYRNVLLWKNGQKYFAKVHHLVAFAFLGQPPGDVSRFGWHVNHKNGNKADNRAENLEWMTAEQNEKHAKETGLKACGIRQWKSVLNDSIVRQIRKRFASGESVTAISIDTGINRETLYHVTKFRTWKHVTPDQ